MDDQKKTNESMPEVVADSNPETTTANVPTEDKLESERLPEVVADSSPETTAANVSVEDKLENVNVPTGIDQNNSHTEPLFTTQQQNPIYEMDPTKVFKKKKEKRVKRK